METQRSIRKHKNLFETTKKRVLFHSGFKVRPLCQVAPQALHQRDGIRSDHWLRERR